MKENKETLTREFCEGKNLVFRPKTAAEAVFIQRQLFKMGFKWYWSANSRVGNIEDSLAVGLELRKGLLFCGGYGTPRDALHCTAQQFTEPFDAKDIKNLYVPANQEFIVELFNRMAEKIEKLEGEVEKLRKEIEPKAPPKPKWGT